MAAMLDAAYAASGSASRDQWCLDNFDAVAAHVGAALSITPGAAANQLLIAVPLHERFPRVAAVFADGLITYEVVRTVVQRGALVIDPDALRALDALLAEALRSGNRCRWQALEKTVDAFVAQVDPHAVRRTQTRARGRSVDVTIEDGSGMATVYATLFAHDAKAFDTRLDALAATVCPADPRTTDQRRADAIGALGHGNDRLACLCGTDDCPAGKNPPATGVVVYVIASRRTRSTEPTGSHRPRRRRLRRRHDLRRRTSSRSRWPGRPTPPPTNAPPSTANPPPCSPSPCATSRSPRPSPRHRVLRQPAARGVDGRAVHPRRHRLPRHGRSDHHPDRAPRTSPTRKPLPAVEETGRLHPLPRHDVPLPRLPRARHPVRPRPHDSVAARTDRGVQPQMSLPSTPPAQDLLGRRNWLAGRTTRRRHRHLDRTRRPRVVTTPDSRLLFPNWANPPHR